MKAFSRTSAVALGTVVAASVSTIALPAQAAEPAPVVYVAAETAAPIQGSSESSSFASSSLGETKTPFGSLEQESTILAIAAFGVTLLTILNNAGIIKIF